VFVTLLLIAMKKHYYGLKILCNLLILPIPRWKGYQMFKGNLTHIVLKTNKMNETLRFYESKFEIKNHARKGIAFKFLSFVLAFEESEDGVSGDSVSHIGILYDSKFEVDELYARFDNPSSLVGGMGEGPFRFYVKDPNGYTLEIETFDGASD
jgi:catechol 2,3-dioxygenase-like lactoylglutathione lyase family enzyme